MNRIADTWRCPHCLEWIERKQRTRHLRGHDQPTNPEE